MRTLRIVSFAAACATAQGAGPVLLNMISVEHRVWGDAGFSPADSYDQVGPAPLSQTISVGDLSTAWYHASSSAGDWSVSASRNGDASYANAYARNTYVFEPSSTALSISLSGVIGVWWFENDAQMTLTDLTTDSLVSIYQSPSYFYPINPFSEDDDDMVDYPIDWTTTVELDVEHQYELVIVVGSHRGEGGSGSASLNLTLVPEPTTVLLAGPALLFLCVRRRRPCSGLVPTGEGARWRGRPCRPCF